MSYAIQARLPCCLACFISGTSLRLFSCISGGNCSYIWQPVPERCFQVRLTISLPWKKVNLATIVRIFPRTGCPGERCTRSNLIESATSFATLCFSCRCVLSLSFCDLYGLVTVGIVLWYICENEIISHGLGFKVCHVILDFLSLLLYLVHSGCQLGGPYIAASALSSSRITLSSVRLTRSSTASQTLFTLSQTLRLSSLTSLFCQASSPW